MVQKYKKILGMILGAHLAVLAAFAAFRMVGGDEGFYLNAARMVGLGKALYGDFFYTQLTLMPTVFSGLALAGWQSFWILRGAAVMAGLLSAVILFLIILKTARNPRVALITLAMYAFSGIVISMHTLFEPLVFAHLLSLATFYFWLHFQESRKIGYLIMTGLVLSALVNLRAVFIVLLPLYLWSIASLVPQKRLRNMIVFLISLVPLTLPTIAVMARWSGNFFYDTFIFQIYREADRSLGYIVSNRLYTLGTMLLDPHLLILLILTVFSGLLLFRSGKLRTMRDLLTTAPGMAMMNLVLIGAVYFIPHPILRHYVEQYIAFAIILIGLNLETIWEKAAALFPRIRKNLLVAVLAGLYLIAFLPYIAINISGIRKADRKYLLSEMRKVTSQMLMLGKATDTVLCEWAGYPFFTGQVPLPGTEIVGFHWPLPLDHAGYLKYKLCDSTYLRESVAHRVPALVVTVNKPGAYYAAELGAGYENSFETDAVSVYKRR